MVALYSTETLGDVSPYWKHQSQLGSWLVLCAQSTTNDHTKAERS